MLFHGCQDAEIALDATTVVIGNVVTNHGNQVPFTGKASAVVSLPLQNPPESLHWAIVDAMRHTGHALLHASFLQFAVKHSAGILKSTITVEQGMRVWVCLYCFVKGLKHKWIVIAFANFKGHDASVIEVEDGTKIDFMYFNALKPLKFRDVGQPFFIWPGGMELAVKEVFSKILWVLCLPCATVATIFNGGFYILCTADTQYPFIIDIDTIVVL